MVSVVRPLIAAAFSGLIGAWVMPADAAKRQPATQPVVERSASGTIIQPTRPLQDDRDPAAALLPRHRDRGVGRRSQVQRLLFVARRRSGPAQLVVRLGLSRDRSLSTAVG